MQRYHPKSMRLAGFAAAAALACAMLRPAVAATPPPRPRRVPAEKWPAESLEFVGGAGQSAEYATTIPDAPGLGDFVTVEGAPNPAGPAVALHFGVDPVPRLEASEPWDFAGFDYELTAGDVVPMLGAVYSATDVSRSRARITLARVTNAKLLKEIGVDRDSVVAPLGRAVRFRFGTGTGHSDSNTVTVKQITAAGAGGKPQEAHLVLEYSGTSYQPRAPLDATVAVGDVLRLLRGTRLTVRRIVSKDEKRKIVGWVELSPKPPATPGKVVGCP